MPAEELSRHFTLDPAVHFLNHGSFGACPRAVLETQSRLRAQLEAEPVRFMVRQLPELMDAARRALAAFVGSAPEDLVFVPNATAGVNSVLRSLPLKRGDGLLCTDHVYTACGNALRFVAERAGAQVQVAPLPFPLSSPDQVVAAVLAGVRPNTRLALIDWITSPTGLVLPMQALVRELHAVGVAVLVDAAHVPGMLPMDLTALGAEYVTGNAHKWICAPKGAAFLHVRRDLQPSVRPLAISHGANAALGSRSRFQVEFDWTGTDDPTAVLSIPAALQAMGGMLPGGWPALREHNRSLVLSVRDRLCALLGVAPPAPDSMIGSLAAVPLPDGLMGPARNALSTDPLQDRLLFEHNTEVPVVSWPAPPKRLVRVAAQVYNQPSDYDALIEALPALLADERAAAH